MSPAASSRVLLGVHLPNFGGAASAASITRAARMAVDAGVDGLWVSDHVVLVEDARSRYPYAPDGSYIVPAGTPWFEAITTLVAVASVVPEVELGTSVCVLPQREPLLLAKQLATADRFAGGRIILGAGVGWLAEEFDVLGAPFDERGKRTDAVIDLLRACWTGRPPAGEYGPFVLPPGVRVEPTPPRGGLPILVGGNSDAALRRAASRGDGWYGAVPAGGLGPEALASKVATLATMAAEAGRSPSDLEVTLRVALSPNALESFGELLAAYAEHGLTRITVDLSWRDEQRACAMITQLREIVGAVPRGRLAAQAGEARS